MKLHLQLKNYQTLFSDLDQLLKNESCKAIKHMMIGDNLYRDYHYEAGKIRVPENKVFGQHVTIQVDKEEEINPFLYLYRSAYAIYDETMRNEILESKESLEILLKRSIYVKEEMTKKLKQETMLKTQIIHEIKTVFQNENWVIPCYVYKKRVVTEQFYAALDMNKKDGEVHILSETINEKIEQLLKQYERIYTILPIELNKTHLERVYEGES